LSVNPNIESLFAQAQAARSKDDSVAYVRLLETIVAQAEHPRALNALGNHALNTQHVEEARRLLERAVRADSTAPPLWFNLSLACRAAGDATAEQDALTRALALDPYFIQAMVHKGQSFARSGNMQLAARFYKDALNCATAQPELAARLSPHVLDVARAGVEANALALEAQLQDALATIKAAHGGSDSARFAEMLNIFHGRQSYQVQRPTLLPFPDLPPVAFYNRTDFAWLDSLEAVTESMRSEVIATDHSGFEPYIHHAEGRPLAQWQELNGSPRWSAYHLLQNGARVHDHIAHCPRTMAALDAAPLADVPGNAPNAFFSVLQPQTRIPPHTGMTNTRLVVHLPLIVPAACGFRVGNHTRAWEVGKAWVFDDTIEHEAWNMSDQARIILIADIWNPLLTALEKDLIRAFFEGLNRYNDGGITLTAGL
jgi:aspartate beta-hydroxylase